ncbi:MAG: phospholipase D-like domain-containing protein [Chitinophagales bacterium]|jgi:phosphatidylserine/phosphatidylglycerophosphate/cardiolipin synthase-like enzyme
MRAFNGVIVGFLLCWGSQLWAQVTTIEEVRQLPLGTTVTIRGQVTTGSALGSIRYLQDETAGIAAFPGAGSAAGFSEAVQRGDQVELTGVLVEYKGLLELSPILAYQVLSSGHSDPAPTLVSAAELTEDLEGSLVRLSCLTFNTNAATFLGASTPIVTDPNGARAAISLPWGHPLAGSAIPSGATDLVGVLTQSGTYFLLPRDQQDLVQVNCPHFDEPLQTEGWTASGIPFRWGTNQAMQSYLAYGKNSQQLDQSTPVASNAEEQVFTLDNLDAGQIYWAQAVAFVGADTIRSAKVPIATPSLSSGEVELYFSGSVDPSFLAGQSPLGTTPEACLAAVIEKINQAQQTIDVAMYNINRTDIAAALFAAQARGVRVRYVAAEAAASSALGNNPPFPVVFGNEDALMHNKFMVVDVDDPSNAWIMSGSMNWTTSNIFNDYNNLLFIQDQSLALAYQMEFEEMWGGSGNTPDPSLQRFGASKLDNTPHHFLINGKRVELWFSPSDKVTDKIVSTIETADNSLEFALFSFTRNEPGNALASLHNLGTATVRGMIDNINDVGSEYDYLLDQGVPVSAHPLPGELHHKYMVVDALSVSDDPLVLTGSHNWSTNAETKNDENTLIIYDPSLARLYRAEFEQRYAENTVSTTGLFNPAIRIWPNPTSDFLVIEGLPEEQVAVEVWSAMGQRVWQAQVVGTTRLSIQELPAGAYLIHLKGSNVFTSFPLQKVCH